MKTLIVEDDFIARSILKDILSPYSDCDFVVDGEEAIQAFRHAWDKSKPYDLICMDIMMPKLDETGRRRSNEFVNWEELLSVKSSQQVKVIMVTALSDPKNVVEAYYKAGDTSYIVKPINKQKFLEEVRNFKLIR